MASLPALAERLEAELARQREAKIAASTIIASEETKQPYKADNFRHLFAEIRDTATAALAADDAVLNAMLEAERACVEAIRQAAGGADLRALAELLPKLWFMHLRHTAVTRLAESGATVPEIAAITGHSVKGVEIMLERYLVRTASMARTAFAKRLQFEQGGR